MRSFPFYKQTNAMDCGPTCLKMIAKYYGKNYSTDWIRMEAGYGKEGVNLLGISDVAEKMGFRTQGVQISFDQLMREVKLPAILHWEQNHFVVMLPLKKGRSVNCKIKIANPKCGILSLSKEEFLKSWGSILDESGNTLGNALSLEVMPNFYLNAYNENRSFNWRYILQYVKNYRGQFAYVFFALLISTLLQLIFPFLTQSLVDIGINTKNLDFITIILVAQVVLVASKTIVDFIRSKLLLSLSSIINLTLLSDFWIKITKLPISYFDTFHVGDTIQRITDNKQVQNFLTGSAINILFSFLNLIIFSFVLLAYNSLIFFVFTGGSIIYFIWIKIFLKIRRKINYESFHLSAKENNATLQLVHGIQEIKLHGAERFKRWEWEGIQASLYYLGLRRLSYNQIQQAGALFINQGKDIIITFFVARLVVEGKLTFGSMLAIQYILGQLSSPIEQIIGFIQSGQDVKISLERLNEIHRLKEEEDSTQNYVDELSGDKDIRFVDLSFAYPGAGNNPVLRSINLQVQEGKTTAVVGISGSGKTTLLKMLLKFYGHYDGDIMIGEINFKKLSPTFWRKQCGAVLQDGYIFNDTIANNIGIGNEKIDNIKLRDACKTANILEFIESLPSGFNTKLGAEGTSISQGQKQRILIAREVYKNPKYIFFDEATNSLDANTEKTIVESLHEFLVGKTVVVVAHRLSTVKNADKIVVLHGGEIVEEGTHEQLTNLKGKYYELVKNQLELGE